MKEGIALTKLGGQSLKGQGLIDIPTREILPDTCKGIEKVREAEYRLTVSK